MKRRSFCTLATVSPSGDPHVAGVLYVAVDRVLYVSTQARSRKGRNLQRSGRAAVCIPVRKFPVGPPFCVQFTANATLLPQDDPEIATHLQAGRLKAITSHGELDDPDSWFARLVPEPRVHTYGIGVPLRQLLRDPIAGSRTVQLPS